MLTGESIDKALRSGHSEAVDYAPIGTLIDVTDTKVEVPRRAPGAMKKLGMPSRVTAFALGVAGLGAGGLAVFITHLEAGPVALLAVGLVFMIVGLAGTLPTRLKVGDSEAAWEIEREAMETFVERVADATPEANQREFLGALSELAEDAPRIAGPALSGLAYERLVMSMIAEAVDMLREDPSLSGLDLATEKRLSNRVADALISAGDGRNLLIEVKAFNQRLSREGFETAPTVSGGHTRTVRCATYRQT